MTDNRECICSSHQQPACAHWRMGNCPDKPKPGNVVLLREPRLGNGAREAMIEVLGKAPSHCLGKWDAPACTDWILAMLWYEGFEIVCLDTSSRDNA